MVDVEDQASGIRSPKPLVSLVKIASGAHLWEMALSAMKKMRRIPERSFDEDTEGAPEVITERSSAAEGTAPSNRRLRDRLMSDPEVRARLREGLERQRRGEHVGPGMTREELEDFLRAES